MSQLFPDVCYLPLRSSALNSDQYRFLCCQLAFVFHLWHDLHVVEQTLPRIIAGTWGGWISDSLPVPVFSETGCGALHACYAASTGKNLNGVSMQSFKTFGFVSASDRRMTNGWDVSDGLYVCQGFIQLYMWYNIITSYYITCICTCTYVWFNDH